MFEAAPLASNDGPAEYVKAANLGPAHQDIPDQPRFVAVKEGTRVVSQLGEGAQADAACPPGSACAAVTPSAPLTAMPGCTGPACSSPPPCEGTACQQATTPACPSDSDCVEDAVITSATDLEPGVPAIAMPIPQSPFEMHALETVAGARIVGEDSCGCPAGQDPCVNPCGRVSENAWVSSTVPFRSIPV